MATSQIRLGKWYTSGENEGEIKVVHVTDQGDEVDFVFQNAKVPIPILSIRKLAHRGCKAEFWKGGGQIIFSSGIVIPIIERLGVYFCTLNIKPPDNPEVFGRPEP